MKKLGFFGGSFNPVTYAHINLANQIVRECNLDKLFFVPIGDFYEKTGLIEFKHRYNMLKLACSYNKKLEVSNIEENKNTKLYAIDIFKIISKEYINDDIFFIMGTDNLEKINNWKNSEDLISKYKYIVLERSENAFSKIEKENALIKENISNFTVISNKEYMNISSSIAKEKIAKNEDCLNLIPKEIMEYIKKNVLYTK